jgi:hypothetical protein
MTYELVSLNLIAQPPHDRLCYKRALARVRVPGVGVLPMLLEQRTDDDSYSVGMPAMTPQPGGLHPKATLEASLLDPVLALIQPAYEKLRDFQAQTLAEANGRAAA